MEGLRTFASVSLAVSLAVGALVIAKAPHPPPAVVPALNASSATIDFVEAGAARASGAIANLHAGAALGSAWSTTSGTIASLWQSGANAVESLFAGDSSPARRSPAKAAKPRTIPALRPSIVRPSTMIVVATPRSRSERPILLAVRVSPAVAPLPPNATAVSPPAPQTLTPDPALARQEAGLVAARMLVLVPARLMPYFDLFFYVSKAAEGPWAQRLFIFHKATDGTLAFEDSFPVSTGRERDEKYFTDTPAGLLELDPDRFEPMHYSHTWDDAKMPWSMFFNYIRHGEKGGIALHAAIGSREDRDLGHRASGGCVRLPLERADQLYHRIQAEEAGQVPILAIDPARNATSLTGEIQTDGQGHDLLSNGYKVLVVIDDYPGTSPGAAISQNLRAPGWPLRLALTLINRKTAPDWNKSACFG
jgi:hypothetical protein